MAAGLRRCVSLGPSGVISPGGSQDYSRNSGFLKETHTGWTRFWADWPSLQPEASLAPDRGSGATRLAALDAQVAAANADGVNVILTLWRFPRWANGTASLTPAQDAAYQLPDRISSPSSDPATRKALEFKVPADVSATSAFGQFTSFLINRYSAANPGRKGVIAALEVCNEPNLQFWPQQAPSTSGDPYAGTTPTVQVPVATMFATARALAVRYAPQLLLMGPGTADRTGDTRMGTSYTTLTTSLLARLAANGFSPGSRFAWSHHNYTDVEYDQGAGSSLGRTTNRAADVRRRLIGKWSGWPSADPSAPGVALTEGGARLSKLASIYGISDPTQLRQKQASLLQSNWNRMYLGADGAGVGILSWYLFYTDINFDDGLCETSGAKRPAYGAWGGLPSFK